jgi:hypothetical protein
MKHEPVVSSDLASVAYDKATRTLEIAFHSGGVYQYDGVPASVHVNLMNAPSKGRYFHQAIKDNYGFQRVR